MQSEALAPLISKTTALVAQFERRCCVIEQQLQSLTQSLHGLAQQLPVVIKQSADGSLQTLPLQVLDRVREGLQHPVDDYQQRLRIASVEIKQGTHALTQQLQELQRTHQLLMWKVLGVTAGCLALLLAGAIWLSAHYAGVIRDNRQSAELMRAYSNADVMLCDGHLCASVDSKGKHYGNSGEYLPIKQR
ncbi:hypothetical protein SAMN05216570_1061 [Dyella sp. OK004]|uniref:hypothetical protein n=1 Tax=Dyella sp. OK004 TaxID=1855292 RepID=UPI0008F38005|nr:hypothetical protein [Dyella sp. OK004]SFR94825.1 hypothetical protein SAMN05216570_1061 [Dyella sp. OK004]